MRFRSPECSISSLISIRETRDRGRWLLRWGAHGKSFTDYRKAVRTSTRIILFHPQYFHFRSHRGAGGAKQWRKNNFQLHHLSEGGTRRGQNVSSREAHVACRAFAVEPILMGRAPAKNNLGSHPIANGFSSFHRIFGCFFDTCFSEHPGARLTPQKDWRRLS